MPAADARCRSASHMILRHADGDADAGTVSAGCIMAVEGIGAEPVDRDIHAVGAACRLAQRRPHVPVLRAAF